MGTGILTGDDMAGNMPGSVRAHTHNEANVNMASKETDMTVAECVVHFMGVGK